MARHCDAAGRTAQAIGHYQRAGERARQTWANEEAIGHLRRALELLGTLPETRERDQQELALQTAIGGPLAAVRGWSHPEYEGVYDRARALASRIGEVPAGVLAALSVPLALKGDLATASELASRALEAAERSGGTFELLMAHYVVGSPLYFQGEFSRSLHHMEQVIGLYDFKQHAPLAQRVGTDFGVGSRIFASFCHVGLGYPDRGLATSEEAVALARRVEHPLSLAMALAFAAYTHFVRWDPGLTQARADEAIALAEKLGFPFPLATARATRGWARAVAQGDDEAVAEIQQGMAELERIGHRVAAPGHLAMLAEASWKVGRRDDALGALGLGVARAQEMGAHVHDAELDRLQAEILLDQDGGALEEAEGLLLRALEIAREQASKWFELRAATSLARLWHSQGRRDEARALLQPVYDWFTEGFDTQDLKDAKALLKELA
jgi:predicted ATPase